ncbi:hypothetical protein ACH4FX_22620 [Streptomyces sp. NPDC018019]|uniref:hypothetical protein n=1 Tax=Streptomyces sp. NPDC018019 TaxID=3365030 RepID=UPI0037B2365F
MRRPPLETHSGIGTRTTTASAGRLSHVRWIAGGTGAGKSTLAIILARRYGAVIYRGDLAQHTWLPRCSPRQHPHFHAARDEPPGSLWDSRSPDEACGFAQRVVAETFAFEVEDLLAMPTDRPVLVDWFGNLPHQIAPLLTQPDQAVFLLPTPEFRMAALRARRSVPVRSLVSWGGRAPEATLAKRLARDELWDAEVRRQAAVHGNPVITMDGARPATDLADEVAARFRLGTAA